MSEFATLATCSSSDAIAFALGRFRSFVFAIAIAFDIANDNVNDIVIAFAFGESGHGVQGLREALLLMMLS